MISVREITQKEEWEAFSNKYGFPFTQSFEYGKWQEISGRDVYRFVVEGDGIPALFCQTIKYSLPFGLHYWYVPYGPIVLDNKKEIFDEFINYISHNKLFSGSLFFRVDSQLFNKKSGFVLSSFDTSFTQPKNEWCLDISKFSEEILGAMHEKHRYSIRLAEKKGVKVSLITEKFSDYLENFLSLMKETASRNSFSLHYQSYYKNIFARLDENKSRSFLAVASHEMDILAIHLIIVEGDTAHYIFGASSDNKKNLCAPHKTHFESILFAKNLGVKIYNFGGISDDKSSWQGITSFKKRFGGYEVIHDKSYDMPIKPFFYKIYKLYKLIRKFV